MMRRFGIYWLFAVSFIAAALAVGEAMAARDAAFADSGMTAGSAVTGDAVTVEPKSDIDTGESVVNVAKRTTIFFVNKTNIPVEIVSIATNDDGNVKSSIASDDCSSQQKIAPGSRCSVVIETIPSNAGAWVAEVLLTHKGTGRIARAKLTGKASGQFSADKKEAGFTLSTKDVKPIDFGDVELNSSKVVRSALMVNDSPETITLLSVDVIAAENGLERLDQGCMVDMELKPGESCPVTLVWKPAAKGVISTDLIIRHSGRLGFAVVPIRGNAKEPKDYSGADVKSAKGGGAPEAGKSGGKPGKLPTAAEEIERELADRVPPLTTDHMPANLAGMASAVTTAVGGEFRLIGTVGNRAIILKPDGMTAVAGVGEEISYGDGKTAKLTNVMPKSAEIFIDGKKKQLSLAAAAEITNRALAAASPGQSGAGAGAGLKPSPAPPTYSSSSPPLPGGTGRP